MEKISKTLHKEYLPVKVFIDDLKNIEGVLEDLTSSGDFEIRTKDYKFGSLDELVAKHNGEKLDSLEISIHNPYINIEFKKIWTRLYCGSDDMKVVGAFHKLDSIISSTTRKPSLFYSYYFTWGTNILWPLFFIASNVKIKVLIGFLLVLSIVWTFWVGYTRLMNSSEIVLVNKGGVRGWYKRNKDQLIIGIIIALVSAILTLVFEYYFL